MSEDAPGQSPPSTAPTSIPIPTPWDEGEGSEYVYTVEFTGEELWGDEGANTTVYIDLWEPYLLPA